MEKFGEVCAFSGEQPPQVLEAAHIDSFARTGSHDLNGGLLLRRDVHTLFDANLMTVEPGTWRIHVAPRIQQFSTYRGFHGQELQVPSNSRPDTPLVEEHFRHSMKVFQHN
jgi:hypothetical protein